MGRLKTRFGGVGGNEIGRQGFSGNVARRRNGNARFRRRGQEGICVVGTLTELNCDLPLVNGCNADGLVRTRLNARRRFADGQALAAQVALADDAALD